jgi:glycosyltransferase involved in cell wall biosynthesis
MTLRVSPWATCSVPVDIKYEWTLRPHLLVPLPGFIGPSEPNVLTVRVMCRTSHQTELPSVSVVVPFYGSDVSGLTQCVESLLNQDYPKDRVAIAVVDNNDPKRLSQSMFGPRCNIFHESLPGSYAARNRGVRESCSEVIAFTDSDCVPRHSWISAGVRSLRAATGPVIVGGSIVFDFGSNHLPNSCELLDSIIHLRQTEYIYSYGFAATANLFVMRELIKIYGPFDARFLSGGDREFGQRLAAAGVGITLAEDAVVLHPARGRIVDLLQKNRRGAGGDKVSLSLGRAFRPLDLFKTQFSNFRHRQNLISVQAKTLGLTPYRLIKLRALLTLCYLSRLVESSRLVLGGKPHRV